jgi:hypothetical protein
MGFWCKTIWFGPKSSRELADAHDLFSFIRCHRQLHALAADNVYYICDFVDAALSSISDFLKAYRRQYPHVGRNVPLRERDRLIEQLRTYRVEPPPPMSRPLRLCVSLVPRLMGFSRIAAMLEDLPPSSPGSTWRQLIESDAFRSVSAMPQRRCCLKIEAGCWQSQSMHCGTRHST